MIKFRVWSKDLSKYRKLDDISNDQGLGMFFEVQKGIGSNVTSICYSINDVVEQFTGLTDVNGNDIYEGDIIKSNYKYAQPKVSQIIIEDGNSYILGEDLATGNEMLVSDHVNEIEVIGNVHANPELLEGHK
ncbi:YopX family protein [Lactiplantibacillus plantarum]|uniref:YopX family protein n=1 Tax=Lactiplantibacillus plantarum TaxID=1590 RepID=UPI00293C75EE|nr:YopX family protein [Lactiplantibacillus plantarum]MDV3526113.1 YopX family protein [Lactiplantibacillus plantarum]